MVVSQNKGTQYRPQNTIVLSIRTPKEVPLILGTPHMELPVIVALGFPQVLDCIAHGSCVGHHPAQVLKDSFVGANCRTVCGSVC